ncbi:Hypothetical protein, putative [Bodo saltans]|uniref:Thioredoxin n=1 Tax=Bodo saltans TaxID=75058 RepID=A0A0S4JAW3_BODSA|nr:Hypothetical protein, putative [Bodo saltans]|eukprot:CUG87342.1 Hypothetical protein, putative [Bodo saltans]
MKVDFVALCIIAMMLLSSAEARRKKVAAKPHAEDGLVKEATSVSFRDVVLDPTLPVMVAIYDTDNVKTTEILAAAIETCAAELKNLVEFVYVDGSSADGKQLAQNFGIQQAPTLILFNSELVPVPGGQEGQFMKNPLGYEGDGTAASMMKFILSSISLNHVERVANDHELADFFAKYSGLDLPRFLYFTEQTSVSPLYIALSNRFRYGGVFGVAFANSSAEVQTRYGVKQFPTLIALTPAGNNDDEVSVMANLNKDSSFDQVKEFIESHVLPIERQAIIRPSMYPEEERLRQKEKDHAKMIKALPVQLVRTKKEWVKLCLTRKKGLCMAVFLDDVSEEKIPYELLANVTYKVAAKSSQELQIVVIDGLHNYEIVNHFGMVNGLPDAVVLNPAKRSFVNLVGSITERGLTNFYLDKAIKAQGKPYKAKKVPKFVKTPAQQSEDGDISDEEEL